jgi:hypothetical protein
MEQYNTAIAINIILKGLENLKKELTDEGIEKIYQEEKNKEKIKKNEKKIMIFSPEFTKSFLEDTKKIIDMKEEEVYSFIKRSI